MSSSQSPSTHTDSAICECGHPVSEHDAFCLHACGCQRSELSLYKERAEKHAALTAEVAQLRQALEEIEEFVKSRVVTYNDQRVAKIARYALDKEVRS